jgi:MDMPI C-terminal domain
MEPDLSTDGVDEALTIMYGAVPTWGRFTPDPAHTVRVQTTDTNRSWQLTLGQFTGLDDAGRAHDKPDLRVAAPDTHGPAAALLRGTAADLDCWLWHRPPVGQIERAGDPVVLEHLDQSIGAGIS